MHDERDVLVLNAVSDRFIEYDKINRRNGRTIKLEAKNQE